MKKFAVQAVPAATFDATLDRIVPIGEKPQVKSEQAVEPFNPIHQSSKDTLARIENGEDPFAKERAAQTELFKMILEYGQLQKRLKEVEKDMQRAAVALHEVRGQGGGVPTIDKMHTILRFLPEIPKNGG